MLSTDPRDPRVQCAMAAANTTREQLAEQAREHRAMAARYAR